MTNQVEVQANILSNLSKKFNIPEHELELIYYDNDDSGIPFAYKHKLTGEWDFIKLEDRWIDHD